MTTTVSTFFWFDNAAEQAAEFYVSLLPDARIVDITRNPNGSAFVVSLELAGHAVVLLNGGPGHPFSDAASLQVLVDSQGEVDRLWRALTADGGVPGPCGWLTDRYGLSWQIVPSELPKLMSGERAAAVAAALRTMSRIDLAALRDAHDNG
ncbi:VOC family protein [Nocardia pseudobrasiliensis]|uniref:Putative 3-demethylubiquinone-9 3-methyltransferase (Glyoxalase superfamily) n=1 Tax=Nocardia pseudobrasiliensis TaxID=45979 RepID=A0A370IH52_9NOCA|nr:VOC family protein [Nocardia pseudobrasiliensis]RDI68784.1 putative 3-demethylubiquinone-9 3-methyltransferase (glyoxalase superfamily) [Nocardia pseudobrasiliensis]